MGDDGKRASGLVEQQIWRQALRLFLVDRQKNGPRLPRRARDSLTHCGRVIDTGINGKPMRVADGAYSAYNRDGSKRAYLAERETSNPSRSKPRRRPPLPHQETPQMTAVLGPPVDRASRPMRSKAPAVRPVLRVDQAAAELLKRSDDVLGAMVVSAMSVGATSDNFAALGRCIRAGRPEDLKEILKRKKSR